MSEVETPELPPGQILTDKFPVVGEQAASPWTEAGPWTLEIHGLVARPMRWSLRQILEIGQQQRTADIHCVTGWSRPAMTMQGLPLAELLAQVEPTADARFVRFVAHTPRKHDSSLPLSVALSDTWIVHAMDGAPLSPEHGGPLRSVSPGRYFYKSVKWLRRIELLAEDQLGYWERESAYHNEADPAQEQRFDESRISSRETVADFRAATDMKPWRGQVLLKARLGGWQPATRDLRELQLKYCSLRQAKLAGVDLREANLSLSNLAGADLRDADLRGTDLEGADFSSADLRGARFDGALLSAARFCRVRNGQASKWAEVEGARFIGCQGLRETDIAALQARGALF